ncbi:MAG: P-type DNA transfer ATPase VirB11 [Steroidobacteraceae bacterium]
MPEQTSVTSQDSSLSLTLRALRPWLDDPSLTEICINRPCEAYVERSTGWECVSLPFADYDWCVRLAKLVANSTRQKIDSSTPVLSATLPTGERTQVVLPPATTEQTVAITIRRPASQVWTLAGLEARGVFTRTTVGSNRQSAEDLRLAQLLQVQNYPEFLRAAVRARKNILVSGPTGSGKTTCTKALILEIPSHERLITIEDTRELVLDNHPNHVRLYYSKDGQGQARVSPKQLLESCLRMKPDRVLLAELRAEEAFYYLRNVNSGHPGSITSLHASSCQLAFEQLVLLIKECPAGRELSRGDIQQMLRLLVDVILQFAVNGAERYIKEIWFRPVNEPL